MPSLKQITPHKLLWIDLEMTGLNPLKDKILEVAAIVTDWDFTEIEVFEEGIGHNPEEVKALLDANSFFTQFPDTKAALLERTAASPDQASVENKLIEVIERHFSGEPALLAGNSIHMDRLFIRRWWPTLETKLHYRMLDVSAWKVVMQGKYDIAFDKSETHRALEDIRESISELRYYTKMLSI